MKHPIWHWYTYFNVAILVAGGLLYGYWYFIDGTLINRPITFQVDMQAVSTDKAFYKHGEEVRINISFCKYRQLAADTDYALVDGFRLPFTQAVVNAPIGCYGVENGTKPYYRVIGDIPDFVDEGIYHIEGTVTYHVNPVKDIVFSLRSKDFSIINKTLP